MPRKVVVMSTSSVPNPRRVTKGQGHVARDDLDEYVVDTHTKNKTLDLYFQNNPEVLDLRFGHPPPTAQVPVSDFPVRVPPYGPIVIASANFAVVASAYRSGEDRITTAHHVWRALNQEFDGWNKKIGAAKIALIDGDDGAAIQGFARVVEFDDLADRAELEVVILNPGNAHFGKDAVVKWFSEREIPIIRPTYATTQTGVTTFHGSTGKPVEVHQLTDDFYTSPIVGSPPPDGSSGTPLLVGNKVAAVYIGHDTEHLIFARPRNPLVVYHHLLELGLKDIKLQVKTRSHRYLVTQAVASGALRHSMSDVYSEAERFARQLMIEEEEFYAEFDGEDFTLVESGPFGDVHDYDHALGMGVSEYMTGKQSKGPRKAKGAFKPAYHPQMLRKPAPPGFETETNPFAALEEVEEEPPAPAPTAPPPANPFDDIEDYDDTLPVSQLDDDDLAKLAAIEAKLGRRLLDHEYLIKANDLPKVQAAPLVQRKCPPGVDEEMWAEILALQAPKPKKVTFTAPTPTGEPTKRETADANKQKQIEELKAKIKAIEDEGYRLTKSIHVDPKDLSRDPAAAEITLLSKTLSALRVTKGYLKQKAEIRQKQIKEAARSQAALQNTTAQLSMLAAKIEQLKKATDFQ